MMPRVLMTSLGGCLKKGERKIAFRVDASSLIGTGHFMRCLTLADELKERGASTRFICRHIPEYLHNILIRRGHSLILLESASESTPDGVPTHASWLGTSQQADARDSLIALSDKEWDWLIVDHYALDATWEKVIRSEVRNILVIDDIADRSHDCDVLLDQNFYLDSSSRYIGKVPEKCQLLLGPRYALLRKEFKIFRQQVLPRTGPVRKLLIFLGGVDANNYTARAIRSLSKFSVPGILVDVVIGAQHPSRKALQVECGRLGFSLHVQTDHMAELMSNADLSIGAGGSASLERCCLGLPSLIVSLAENQVAIAKALHSFGACIYLGSERSINEMAIISELDKLIVNIDYFSELSKKSYSLVDGEGVERTCQQMYY